MKPNVTLTGDDLIISIQALNQVSVPVRDADRIKVIINKMTLLLEQLQKGDNNDKIKK
ncbi:MAG: hypothetical protein IPM48_14970 [Saprospiraceae bacterium]|nr:hypothetical protein [Saprospiraceae bacterium]